MAAKRAGMHSNACHLLEALSAVLRVITHAASGEMPASRPDPLCFEVDSASQRLPLQGDDAQKAAAAEALLAVLEAVRIVAVLLTPITPRLSQRILEQLGVGDQAVSWRDVTWGMLKPGSQLPKPSPVFQRLEGDYVISAVEEVAV